MLTGTKLDFTKYVLKRSHLRPIELNPKKEQLKKKHVATLPKQSLVYVNTVWFESRMADKTLFYNILSDIKGPDNKCPSLLFKPSEMTISLLVDSVAEPHYFYAAPASTLPYSKQTFYKILKN
jgi:hypothetical protein